MYDQKQSLLSRLLSTEWGKFTLEMALWVPTVGIGLGVWTQL